MSTEESDASVTSCEGVESSADLNNKVDAGCEGEGHALQRFSKPVRVLGESRKKGGKSSTSWAGEEVSLIAWRSSVRL